MHIHPVFHVSLLEPHVANMFPDRVVAPPLPTQVDGLPEFEVHQIDLSNADIAIRDFHEKFPDKPRPRS